MTVTSIVKVSERMCVRTCVLCIPDNLFTASYFPYIVLEKKDDRTRNFSDLDNVAAFKQLDCSCKIPHRAYPSADYEVPVATIQRSQGKLLQQRGKEDFENTYEIPLDAKMTTLQGQGAEFKDAEDEWTRRSDSIYEVPRPVEEEEEEYTIMASVPLESGFPEATDNIYENVVNQ